MSEERLQGKIARVTVFICFSLVVVACGTRREVIKTHHAAGTVASIDSLHVTDILNRLHTFDFTFGLDQVMTIDWTLAPDSATPVPAKISMTTTGTANSVEAVTESRDSSSVSVSESVTETTDTLQESERVSGSGAAKGESPAGRWSLVLGLLVTLVIAVCVLRFLSLIR